MASGRWKAFSRVCKSADGTKSAYRSGGSASTIQCYVGACTCTGQSAQQRVKTCFFFRWTWYTSAVSNESNSAVLDKLFDPVEKCLTPEFTRRLVGVRAPAEVHDRLDELADKSSDGTLTADERRDYDTYV